MRVISGKARGTKLKSIEDKNTRPTLDRVKESLFNILQDKIDENTILLDLFAGSGAIGIETLSRGAKKVYFCDYSKEDVKILKENLEKTRFLQNSVIYIEDYKECLMKIAKENEEFDLIFLDPPYEKDLAVDSTKKILSYELLKDDGIIVIETDNPKRDIEGISNISDIQITDERKYGRVTLLFLSKNKD